MSSETVAKIFDTLRKNLSVGKFGDEEKMRFSKFPGPGDSGFSQWHEAMKMVCRLPEGIPAEFRKTLWLMLSEQHLLKAEIEWTKIERICFNEQSNPDDEELGAQIVKDLHRTGCSSFCGGAEAEFNQALLKRVLLAYARWNKKVGYCQGFNMLAALLLEVMDHDQAHALKAMIYLVEGVLPPDYFGHSLRGLSVDMAAFRDLLRLRLPELSKHLDQLQNEPKDGSTGSSYEPPLVNVFTMQWFLTLFSTCLPQPTVLRVWDLVFLEGSEILLRTALALWEVLEKRVAHVESADEFYSIMTVLTREMVQFGLMDTNQLIEKIVRMAPFPFPGLSDLRDKYTYNIAPWMEIHGARKPLSFRKLFKHDGGDDDDDEESQLALAAVFSNVFPLLLRSKGTDAGGDPADAGSPHPEAGLRRRVSSGLDSVRASGDKHNLDISALKNQYSKLKERQRQAHVILTGAAAKTPGLPLASSSAVAMNHLLLGKRALSRHAHRMAKTAAAPLASGSDFIFRRRQSDFSLSPLSPVKPEDKKESTKQSRSTRLLSSDSALIRTSDSPADGIDANGDTSSSSTELCDGSLNDTDDDQIDDIPDEEVNADSSNPTSTNNTALKRERKSPEPIVSIQDTTSQLLLLDIDSGPDRVDAPEGVVTRMESDLGHFSEAISEGTNRFSIAGVRRQRSFDAQKVIEENLEILEKLQNRPRSHSRTSSGSKMDPNNSSAPEEAELLVTTEVSSSKPDVPHPDPEVEPGHKLVQNEAHVPKHATQMPTPDLFERLSEKSRVWDLPQNSTSTNSVGSPDATTVSGTNCKKKDSKTKSRNPSSPGPVFIEPTKPLTFNPFPARVKKTHQKEVAVKLGLYDATGS